MHIEMGMARLCAEAEDRMPEGASDAGAACRYRHRYRTHGTGPNRYRYRYG